MTNSDGKPCGTLILPNMDGYEIHPDVYLIGQPLPRPDLGGNKMACLANVRGNLCVVELETKFSTQNKPEEGK